MAPFHTAYTPGQLVAAISGSPGRLATACIAPAVTASILAILALLTGSAEAQRPAMFTAVAPLLSARLGDSLDSIDAPGGQIIRRRLVHIAMDQLAAARAEAGRRNSTPLIALNVFDDLPLSGPVTFVAPTASGTGYVLSGRLRSAEDPDDPRVWDMSLLVYGEAVTGTIRTFATIYNIRPLNSTVHVVTQFAPQLPPGDVPLRGLPAPPNGVNLDHWDPETSLAATENTQIDVAVLYTLAAARGAERLSAASNIVQLVDQMVFDANAAYRASGVNIRLNLVALESTDYTETPDAQANLHRLITRRDGYLDAVHQWRDIHGADLVHLIVDVTLGRGIYAPTCGIAQISDERTEGAFGVTHYFCLANYTFAHELGHNLGLYHDRYQTLRRQGRAHSYRHGYVNQRAFDFGAPVFTRWRTIMAYDAQCKDFGFPPIAGGGQYHCEVVRYFSNPDLRYNGHPLGVPYRHPAPGFAGPADARRRLNEMARRVANYRHKLTGSDPDLAVESLTASRSALTPGELFTLTVGVRNQGGGGMPETAVAYWRVGEFNRPATFGVWGAVPGLASLETGSESARLNAPAGEGTYYYQACVYPHPDVDKNRVNDCATSQSPIIVRGGSGSVPDLSVQSALASDVVVAPHQWLSFAVSVQNQGGGPSAEGVFYLTRREGVVSMLEGEATVPELAAGETRMKSFDVSAPRSEGTYVYDACVFLPEGDLDPNNNCTEPTRGRRCQN